MKVGERIRYYRQLRGIGQEYLALMTGIRQGTFSRSEHDRDPRFSEMILVSRVLCIPIGWFVPGSPLRGPDDLPPMDEGGFPPPGAGSTGALPRRSSRRPKKG